MTGLLTWLILFPESLKQLLLLYKAYKCLVKELTRRISLQQMLLHICSAQAAPGNFPLDFAYRQLGPTSCVPASVRFCASHETCTSAIWISLMSQGAPHHALLCNMDTPNTALWQLGPRTEPLKDIYRWPSVLFTGTEM